MQEQKPRLKPFILFLVAVFVVLVAWKSFSTYRLSIVDSSPSEQTKEDCPLPAPRVEVRETDEIGTQIVLLDGQGVGQIVIGDPAEEIDARVIMKTPCNAWIVASTTKRPEYRLYDGDDRLYQLQFSTKELRYVSFEGLMTDLASDQTTIATIVQYESRTVTPAIVLIDTTTSKQQQEPFMVPAPYNEAGSAKFSPDGTKVAYAAVERDENNKVIKRAIFIIDLATGEQTLGGRYTIPEGQAPYITGWSDNSTPVVSDQP